VTEETSQDDKSPLNEARKNIFSMLVTEETSQADKS